MSSPVLEGFLASLVAGLGTGLGALPIFMRRDWGPRAQQLMLAAAGRMMLGATFFSLLMPALGLVQARGGTPLNAPGICALGVVLGAVVAARPDPARAPQQGARGRAV